MFSAVFFLIIAILAVIGAWGLVVQEWIPTAKRIGLGGIILAILIIVLAQGFLSVFGILNYLVAYVSLGVLVLYGISSLLKKSKFLKGQYASQKVASF